MTNLSLILFVYWFATVSGSDEKLLYDQARELGIENELFDEIDNNHLVHRLRRSDKEDANYTVPELVRNAGYPLIEYNVTTHDGYILKVHRIPYGINGPRTTHSTCVVFLMHGILASSADWVITGPGKGLAYILADNGYDVWMGNARGNRYSRKHIILDPDDAIDKRTFWDFSWHEIGTIDVPTMIDYALVETEQESLFHIGHSQGTTTFYVMCSEHPEYNKKIKAHFSLSPVAFMNNLFSPVFKVLAFAQQGISVILNHIGQYEFLPAHSFLNDITRDICGTVLHQSVCANVVFIICGFNQKQMNMTLLPILLGHLPAGAATKQLVHYAQEINSGKFRQFDYGIFQNIKEYDSFFPPNYNLSNIDAPTYLFYSMNDWLSSEIDVSRLCKQMKRCTKICVEDYFFNHLDYIYGIDAVSLVYKKILKIMSRIV